MSSLDGIIDTVSATHAVAPLLGLLKPNGKLVMVGGPEKPLEVPVFPLLMGEQLNQLFYSSIAAQMLLCQS